MLKAIKVWQLIVVGAVVLGGAAYGVYSLVIADGDDALSADQQVIPVQLGDLINRVSTNGRLFYPTREVPTFASQGTVAEVLVSEGDAGAEGRGAGRRSLAGVLSSAGETPEAGRSSGARSAEATSN